MERKTPLYEKHVALQGRIVEFGGFLMPVQYPAGVIAEHMAVREKAGLFDVSHMGELRLSGKDALAVIQNLVTTDISPMKIGAIKYAMFCNEKGGVIDDLLVYRLGDEDFLLVVNAGNRDKDAAWVESHLFGEVNYRDDGDRYGELALQGPLSKEIITKLCPEELLPSKYYTFAENVPFAVNDTTVHALVSRTGYTGEYGYEIYCEAKDTAALWDAILGVGTPMGLLPCGLGARDTLRMEAAMPLYGHELNDDITPKMAGLPCKTDGKDFIGKEAIIARGTEGMTRIGLTVVGRGIVREHCDLYTEGGEKVGYTTSGTHCPTLGYGIAMGYVKTEYSAVDTVLFADVRGRRIECKLVPMPFMKTVR